MAIRNTRGFDMSPAGCYRRKADQEHEMVGLARADSDTKDAERHLKKAKEYDRLAREAEANQ